MNDYESPPVPAPSHDDRLWAMGAQVGALIAARVTSWFAGIAGAAAALVVWFLVRDRSAFAAEHAKEAFNFNVSMFIYMCIAGLIGLLLVGGTVLTLGIGALVAIPAGIVLLMALFALAIAWLVFTVIAAIKAYDGEMYRYPLAIRLLK